MCPDIFHVSKHTLFQHFRDSLGDDLRPGYSHFTQLGVNILSQCSIMTVVILGSVQKLHIREILRNIHVAEVFKLSKRK